MELWGQLFSPDYKKRDEKFFPKRSRSLGTQDFMGEQTSAGTGIGIQNTYHTSTNCANWNAGNGMLVTTSATTAPSSTYSLTSALSMK